jgi:hypothetical protein
MLYGALGRTGVYPLQEALRDLGRGLPLESRVDLTRRLLADLPASNWFRRNPFLGDHKRSDAELVDLLLHARDRAYRVNEVIGLLATAGLAPAAFVEPLRYDPATYLRDPGLLKRLDGLSGHERAALAEILAGNMKTHVVYAVPQAEAGDRVAGPELAEGIRESLSLTTELGGLKVQFALPRLAPAILQRVDGKASLGEIHAGLQALDSGLDWPRFKAQFDQLYRVLNGLNRLLIFYPASRAK